MELSRSRLQTIIYRHGIWILPGFIAQLMVIIPYLNTHPYPALGGGLYQYMAYTISQNHYLLPTRIPHYTKGGIPFAYPPLILYGIAVLQDLGVRPLTLARLGSAISPFLYLPGIYFFTYELRETRFEAGFATAIVAVSPIMFRLHLSAGGIVRSTAFLFTVAGLYTGLHVFRDSNSHWVLPASMLFGLALLSHALYATFFGISYVLFWLYFRPTVNGLRDGVLVASGGIILAAPWWATVVFRHGFQVYLGATNSQHLFSSGPLLSIVLNTTLFSAVTEPALLVDPWVGTLLVATGLLLLAEKWFLPVWLLGVDLLLAHPRWSKFIGILVLVAGFSQAMTLISNRLTASTPRRSRMVSAGIALLVMSHILFIGMGYARGTPRDQSSSLHMFLDNEDMAAMEWVATETRSNASFLVVGSTAEWFPQQTDRTILIAIWGTEWSGGKKFNRQSQIFRQLAYCSNASCLTDVRSNIDSRTDFVYVPKGRYSTIYSGRRTMPDTMQRSLEASSQYEIVFENDGVIIVEVNTN